MAVASFVPDRVIPASDGGPADLWVFAVLPKAGWVPHSAGDFARAEHPGSAIRYHDQIYEVIRVEESAEGGYAFRYCLRPWDPQFVIRHLVDYSLEAQRDAAASHEDMERAVRLRSLILWLFPIAGFAPDPLQRDWGNKTGLSLTLISFGSALFGLAVAFSMRGSLEDTRFVYVIYYLALESFARLFWIAVSHRPHGSLLLTLPYLVWQGLEQRRHPGPAQGAGPALLTREDKVRPGRGGNSLEIHSSYFDTALAGSDPVMYERRLYRPMRWYQEGKGLSRRWIYELEKLDPQAAGPSAVYAYPRSPERQKAVEEFTCRADLALTFSLVWGAYPRRDQLRLQLLYQYQGPRSTAITAGLFLIAGVLQLCLTAALYRGTVLPLAGPAYLTLESLYRLYRSTAAREPAGSVVGYVLRLAIPPPK